MRRNQDNYQLIEKKCYLAHEKYRNDENLAKFKEIKTNINEVVYKTKLNAFKRCLN